MQGRHILLTVTMLSQALVGKCLDRKLGKSFQHFSTVRARVHDKRSNGLMLVVPKVELQFSKSSFRSMGVKIFFYLPIKSRRTDNLLMFKGLLKSV